MTVDGDLQGVPRIHGALSAHMWPGLVMKDGDEGDDAATRSNPDQGLFYFFSFIDEVPRPRSSLFLFFGRRSLVDEVRFGFAQCERSSLILFFGRRSSLWGCSVRDVPDRLLIGNAYHSPNF